MRRTPPPRVRSSSTACRSSGRRITPASCVWRAEDRKSTRLNSSHLVISYAVFCLKKKKERELNSRTCHLCRDCVNRGGIPDRADLYVSQIGTRGALMGVTTLVHRRVGTRRGRSE